MAEVDAPLNKEQLERLFSPAPRAVPERFAQGGRGSGDFVLDGTGMKRKGGAPRGTEVCLLTSKHAQNLAIVLRQVTLPTDELTEVLRCMRVSYQVSAETLEHVYENLVPTLLECSDLVNYDGPVDSLRDIERQLLPLARLPRLKARLRTMVFSKNMPNLNTSLLARIRLLRNACEQVRNSSALRHIMCAGLRVGNYLNHGIEFVELGGGHEVRGFSVESLLKFRDFRAAQGGEASALHCMVAHLHPNHPDLLRLLRKELQAVLEPSDGVEACLLDGGISELNEATSRFQSEIDLVQGEMDRFAGYYRAEGEGPLEVMQRLLEDGREMATGLDEELRTTLTTARRLLEFFGERQQAEPQTGWANETYVSVEKFFATIREFVTSFEECWREVLDNPRKLRLDVVLSAELPELRRGSYRASISTVPISKEVSASDEDGSSDCRPPQRARITKPNPKAAAAAACAAAAAQAVFARKAKAAAAASDAPADDQCSSALAAEAANVAMRRRRTTGMLRLGGADFGAARLLLPPGPAAQGASQAL